MAEHYTRNTETATAWCKKCNRNTDHRVDDGRRGPCLICLKTAQHPTRAVIPNFEPPEPEQKELFEKK